MRFSLQPNFFPKTVFLPGHNIFIFFFAALILGKDFNFVPLYDRLLPHFSPLVSVLTILKTGH